MQSILANFWLIVCNSLECSMRSKASFLYNTCELHSEQNCREYAQGVKRAAKLASRIFACAHACIRTFSALFAWIWAELEIKHHEYNNFHSNSIAKVWFYGLGEQIAPPTLHSSCSINSVQVSNRSDSIFLEAKGTEESARKTQNQPRNTRTQKEIK